MNENRNILMVLSTNTKWINILGVLLAINLLSNNFGIATPSLFHFVALYLLLGITLLNLPLKYTIQSLRKKNSYPIKLIFGLLLLIGAFLLLNFSKSQLLWISSVPLLISGLDLSLWEMKRNKKELQILARASFAYAIVFLLLQTIPFLWNIYQQGSLLLSHAVGILIKTPLLLGPTTSGFGIFLVALVFIITIFLLIPKKAYKDITWFLTSIGGLIVIWFFYLVLLGSISYESKSDSINLHPLFFLLGLIPIYSYYFKTRFKRISLVETSRKRTLNTLLRNGMIWAAALLFLSTTFLTIFINAGVPSAVHPKVIFYGDHMLGTWDVPEYGKYGKDAVGMFGLWPIYLTTLGYETEILVKNRTKFLDTMEKQNQNITRYINLSDYTTIIETKKITNEQLKAAAIFVITNLNVSFSEDEQTIIWQYVQNGGSLLVLGDHTNVGGIQTPLNELLHPVGIRFRFDAALPFDDRFKWLTCTHLNHHPVTIPLTGIDNLQYGVGASLDISLSSFPIIIGTYTLSDEGNQTNEEIAFLGDYEYNKGEQIGDVILVAGAYYGEGKVLVFGDTSSFQNAALTFSYPFIQSTFNWLINTQSTVTTVLQIGVSLMFLIGTSFIYYLWKKKTIHFTLFSVVICISLVLTTSLNPLIINDINVTPIGNIVSIDASHNERFNLESFTDNSINGLIVNLHRNNYLPILLRDFSKEKISASKILIFIAPTLKFTGDEVTFLKQYMTGGGIIILTTGYDDKDASLPLLQEFDINVEQIPLGPVPYVESNTTLYQNEPRFVDSWPLTFNQNKTISYYNFSWENFTFHLVIFIKQGKGGLLVIGDSQYLLDKNIESIYDYWPGNILFLKYFLDEIQSMEDI